jgi:hypothetical protein
MAEVYDVGHLSISWRQMDPSHGAWSVYCHPRRLAVSCSGLIRCPLVLIASGVAPYANTVPDASTPSSWNEITYSVRDVTV